MQRPDSTLDPVRTDENGDKRGMLTHLLIFARPTIVWIYIGTNCGDSGRPGPAGEIGRVSEGSLHRAEVCGESWRGV